MTTLKLVGEDGNAFAILGRAQRVFRQAGVPQEEISAIIKEATSGDYDNLLVTIVDAAEKHGIEVE